jgi:eukaryotic-like serine/threonine-protein kinase
VQVSPGTQIGPYLVLEEVARGGQGVLLKAKHVERDLIVALKLLLEHDPDARARFTEEARTLAHLRHPSLLRVIDLGELPNGFAFMAIEFVSGQTLQGWVRSAGPPPLERLIEVLESLAESLHYCHEAGVVHRDVKPQNVMLDSEGRVRLVDFGLVKRDRLRLAWSTQDRQTLTQQGEVLGTPAYMPPEQISAEVGEVDRRSDVYALGGVLYYLLTGSAPFGGSSAIQVLFKVVEEPPANPKLLAPEAPAHLVELCLRSLSKSPAERPQSAAEFAQGLRPQATGSSRTAFVASGALLLVLALGVGALLAARASTPLEAEQSSRVSPRPSSSQTPTSPEPGQAAYEQGEALRETDPKAALSHYLRGASLGHARSMWRSARGIQRGSSGAPDAERALGWYRKAAEAGVPEAMTDLGIFYANRKDYVAAMEWSRRAVEVGSARAARRVGALYAGGLGVAPDHAEAARWWRRAIEGGDVQACLELGHAYRSGVGVQSNEQEARRLYIRAAKGGNAEANFLCGSFSQREGKFELAVSYYEGAAKKDNLSALIALASLHSTGRGIERSTRSAERLLLRAQPLAKTEEDRDRVLAHLDMLRSDEAALKAHRAKAEAGQVESMRVVARVHAHRCEGDEAQRWYLRAIERGDALAMAELARLAQKGVGGVAKDPARALELYRRAAKAGEGSAMLALSDAWRLGQLGLDKNQARALEWLDRGRLAGDAPCTYALAQAHLRGFGVAQDNPKGMRLLRAAIDLGSSGAMNELGVQLRRQDDHPQAHARFLEAANLGNPNAMFNLSIQYRRGQGVAKDPVKAETWRRRARKEQIRASEQVVTHGYPAN